MAEKKNDTDQIMTNREILRDMHTKVSSMYGIIYGDSAANVPGISHRVKSLEDSDKKRGGIYILISAISAGIAIGAKTLAEHFK